jgi:segregation and condensation protein B
MASSHHLAALESLLFVSGEPLSFGRLAKLLQISEDEVMACIRALAEKYAEDGACGLQLIVKDKKAELATKPENIPFIESLTKSSLQENLSKPALEVLSIIAYRTPITRVEIESIRGVNCSFTLRNLLLRDLIERQGNPEDARGYVYLPTFRFLESLGLRSITELPDHEALSRDERLRMVLEEEPAGAGQEQKTETEK